MEESVNKKKIFAWSIAALIVLAIYVWMSTPMVVTVAGTGEVVVPADKIQISMTATQIDNSALAASQKLKDKVEALKQVLYDNRATDENITVSELRIVPAGTVIAGASGYQATVAILAEFPGISILDTNTFIPLLYERGASLVTQPVLKVIDEEKYEQEALKEALADAREKAKNVGNRKLRFIRRVGAITVSANPTQGTSTTGAGEQKEADLMDTGRYFKILKAVTVTYRMW